MVIASMAAHGPVPVDADTENALATVAGTHLGEHPAVKSNRFADAGSAYSFAKEANLIRVRAAAAQWGSKGARVNSISPGVISTAMGQAELNGERDSLMRQMVDNSGVRRLGTPDDIASAAEFLLGDRAAFITGTDLLVDGGVTAAGSAAR